jgi:hypothetical protein
MGKTKSALFLAILLMSAGIAMAASQQWVHVHIENPAEDERVRVNIPIALVESMMPLIEEKGMEHGVVRLHDSDVTVKDLRNAWKQIRNTGDSEFVSIQNKDANVRVFTKAGFLYVQPQDHARKNIDIRIPLVVVDALLSGEGEELNLKAAVRALKDSGVKDIITVKDEDKTVRVWIDESNTDNQAR